MTLPGVGSAGGFSGKRHDTDTFYSFTSYTTPSTIYRYNMQTGESSLFRQPSLDFTPERLRDKAEFFTAAKTGRRCRCLSATKKG